MNLKISAWACIISAFLLLPNFIAGIAIAMMPDNALVFWLFVAMLLITLIIVLPIFVGYLIIARKVKLRFLGAMVYVSLGFAVLFNMYTLITVGRTPIWSLIIMMLMGIVEMVFGAAIIQLRKTFGGLATGIGVLYIVNGFFYLTIIFVIFIPFTAIASTVMEAIMFFSAAKKYS